MSSLPDTIGRLPEVARPRHVVFADFDETYLAHHGTPERVRARQALEDFLAEHCERHGIVFAWVTGSTIDALAARVRAHELRLLPHVIASSRGAEMDLVSRERGWYKLPAWEQAIADSGFSAARIAAVRAALEARGVSLRRQPQRGIRIESYYYDARDDTRDEQAMTAIRALAQAHGLGVNASPCNPGAGDPEGAWDVDFFPRVCGKPSTVRFLLEHYGVPRTRALAFGDSGGDLSMLETVAHGFLVANATPSARAAFPRVAAGSYAAGILAELARYLDAAWAPGDP